MSKLCLLLTLFLWPTCSWSSSNSDEESRKRWGITYYHSNSIVMAICVQAWDHRWAPETWNVDHTTSSKCKVFRRKLSFHFIETWPEGTRNNIKVKTPSSASSDYAGAMNVEQQNLNTVKSLLRQLFVKRSLRKLNQITHTKKESLL